MSCRLTMLLYFATCCCSGWGWSSKLIESVYHEKRFFV
jgi:hypothetical protein